VGIDGPFVQGSNLTFTVQNNGSDLILYNDVSPNCALNFTYGGLTGVIAYGDYIYAVGVVLNSSVLLQINCVGSNSTLMCPFTNILPPNVLTFATNVTGTDINNLDLQITSSPVSLNWNFTASSGVIQTAQAYYFPQAPNITATYTIGINTLSTFGPVSSVSLSVFSMNTFYSTAKSIFTLNNTVTGENGVYVLYSPAEWTNVVLVSELCSGNNIAINGTFFKSKLLCIKLDL